MSFPPQYIPSEPTAASTGPGPISGPGPVQPMGLPPVQEDVQIMDPIPGDAVVMLRQTRRSVGFVGLVLVTLGLLVTLPAVTFAWLKWNTDPLLARKLVMAALGGITWLIPACYLRIYARRIKRLIDYPTGDLLASALAAQRGFWRTASVLLAVVMLIGAGLLGRFVSSKGIGAVSADVRSRIMEFAGKPEWTPGVPPPADLAPAVPAPADPTPVAAAPQATATEPAATQPIATKPAAPQPAVAATPAESTPPPPPVQPDQASVETGETPATDE